MKVIDAMVKLKLVRTCLMKTRTRPTAALLLVAAMLFLKSFYYQPSIHIQPSARETVKGAESFARVPGRAQPSAPSSDDANEAWTALPRRPLPFMECSAVGFEWDGLFQVWTMGGVPPMREVFIYTPHNRTWIRVSE
jgi:hypothetical protein